MIIIIISMVMLVLGVILYNEFYSMTGCGMAVLGFISLVILLPIAISAHVFADNTVQKNKIQYEGLCKRYEVINSEYEDVSKSDVVADIAEWNEYVYNTKYWTKNPWTSWFNSKEVADNLEYISLD